MGSVRHLSGTALPRRRRLRIQDPWLLALRSAILTALVLALAGPALTRRAHPRRWALLAPELAEAGSVAPVVDSLRRAGAEIRILAPGFPAADSHDAAQARSGRATTALDFWSLLPAADAECPPAPASCRSGAAEAGPMLRGIRPRWRHGRRPRPCRATRRIRPPSRPPGARDSVSRLIARGRRIGATAQSIVTEPARPQTRRPRQLTSSSSASSPTRRAGVVRASCAPRSAPRRPRSACRRFRLRRAARNPPIQCRARGRCGLESHRRPRGYA